MGNVNMTHYHPENDQLLSLYLGHASQGEALIFKAHAELCGQCRQTLSLFDALGGMMFEDTAPVVMREDALNRALARLDRGLEEEERSQTPSRSNTIPVCLKGFELPSVLVTASYQKQKKIAPGVWLLPLDKDYQKGTDKTYLMYVAPGMTMPIHDHKGTEITLVLEGAFSDDKGHYQKGDLLINEPGDVHAPSIGSGDGCLCLFTARGPIAPKTVLGKILQPFAGI
jgi:putative transcriptional regulator